MQVSLAWQEGNCSESNITMGEHCGLSSDRVTRRLAVAIAVMTAGAGLLRIFAPNDWLDGLDSTTLSYFGIAAAVLFLRDIRSLAFGDYKVEFERTQQLAAEAKATAENAQATALGAGTGLRRASGGRATAEPLPGTVRDDPWKGVFGGTAVSNDRRIDASIERLSADGELFTVRLQVASTNPSVPLRDAVQFFLHPTFVNDRPVVAVGPGGTADLVLRAYGAFTVGVVADNGDTRLELDLAALPHAPRTFRER